MKQPKKLPSEIVALLLPRLQDEYNAFYMYRSASNWCNNVGYMKAGKYFAKESEDELAHAKKIEDFLVQWNVTPELPMVAQPTLEFKNLPEIIEAAYDVEYKLYEMYEETSVKIFETGDICVFDFLQPFRAIQTASVAEYSDMINILDGVNTESKFELFMLEENLFEG
jgi:ferritin